MRSDLAGLCALALFSMASVSCRKSAPPPTLTATSHHVAGGQTLKVNAVAAPGLSWFVNGTKGGNAQVGTIDGAGVFTAPAVTSPTEARITASHGSGGDPSAPIVVTVLPAGVVSKTKNPQVASYSVRVEGDAKVSVELGETTSYGRSTWVRDAPKGGGEVSILVAGMKANTTYHLRATATYPDGTTLIDGDRSFTTGECIPIGTRPHLVVSRDANLSAQSGVEVLDLSGFGAPARIITTDLDGNILWAYDSGLPIAGPNGVKLLSNGHFLINFSIANATAIDGLDSQIREVDLSGEVVWSLTADELNRALAGASCKGCNVSIVGTHHDFLELPNGHLVILAALKSDRVIAGTPGMVSVVGDVLIELDEARKPIWAWNAFDHPESLDLNRHPWPMPDWLHSNAVLYSPSDGALLLSIRNQHWLARINYADGKGDGRVLSRLGYQGDFPLTNGVAGPDSWFFSQHGPSFVGKETSGHYQVAVFDNGDHRLLDEKGTLCGGKRPCQSRVTILDVDEAAKSASISWTFPLPLFGFFGGNAEVLTNGHVEYDVATVPGPGGKPGAVVAEVTRDAVPQVAWLMQIGGQFAYRTFRIPSMYPGVQW